MLYWFMAAMAVHLHGSCVEGEALPARPPVRVTMRTRRVLQGAAVSMALLVIAAAASRDDGPGALYAIWNSGQQQGYGGYVAPQLSRGAGYATSPYYNALNTAELSSSVSPYDAAALQYSAGVPGRSGTQAQMQTLHALAAAKQLYHTVQAPSSSSYSSAVKTAANPAAALHSLRSKAYSGSASKQIGQARLAIEQVLQESKADTKIAMAAKRSARLATSHGNSWKKLLKRESGSKHSRAMASDWLSTAVASHSTGASHKYARAQLEAALSQVDGHFHHDAERGAWQNQQRQRNSELAAMSQLAHAVMYKALSGSEASPSNAVAPMAPNSYSTSAASTWGNNRAGSDQGVKWGSGGAGPSGGKAAMSGVAPGLSSYDAQILAGGPPQ